MEQENITLSGYVISGRNIGASMIERSKERIKDILGTEPYAGTLNVVMDNPFLFRLASQIDEKGKQFAIYCSVEGIACLIYRWRGAPLHVVEIIAPMHLRSALNLKEGQRIDIIVPKDKMLPPSTWRWCLWRLFYQQRLHVYYDDDMHKLFTGKYFKFFHKKVCQRKSEFKS